MVKSAASILLELAGVGTIAFGLWMLAPWLGVTAGGLGLALVGTAIDPPKRQPARRKSS